MIIRILQMSSVIFVINHNYKKVKVGISAKYANTINVFIVKKMVS